MASLGSSSGGSGSNGSGSGSAGDTGSGSGSGSGSGIGTGCDPRPGCGGDGSGPAPFPGTRWSLVALLAEPKGGVGSGTRRKAFEELALAYWRPVYRTLRTIHRKAREEAEDLTQAFFLGLLEKRVLERFEADPSAGRFRNLVRALLDGFVRTADRDARRKKRGGDRRQVALDPDEIAAVEVRIAGDDGACGGAGRDPFEEEWRATVIDRALAAFFADVADPLWQRRSAVFRAYDIAPADDPSRPTYAEIARRFGLKPHDVKNDLVAARRRFAELVAEQLRDASRDESEVREELRALFGGPPP